MISDVRIHSEVMKDRARAFESLRQRLLGRRMLYINTANKHPDLRVAEAMRERANVIELVISDLEAAVREEMARELP